MSKDIITKLIVIGSERNLFDENSKAAKRIIEYGELFGELHIIVFTLARHQLKQKKLSKNVILYPTNALTRLDYVLNAYVIGKDIIEEENGEWVISTQDPFESGLAGYLLKRKTNAKFHIQMHGDFWSPYYRSESLINKVRLFVGRIVIPKADCIRVVSTRIKKSLKKHFNPSVPMSVLPIVASNPETITYKAKFDVHKKYPQFDFIALMVSRLERVKNIELALMAFRNVVKEYPRAGLLVLGDGSGRKFLESLCSKLTIEKNVIFLGWQEDVYSYMNTSDVFLNTSNHEGYCLSLVESAQAKCPIITTDVGVVGEILNETNALICPVGDERCIQSRIEIAIENKDKISKLGEAAFIDVIGALPRKETYLKKYKESIEACV